MAAASLRQSAPRIETPKISPRPKAAISLEEWEVKTPLTDSEARSVARLQRACEEKPIPEQIRSAGVSQVPPLSAGRKPLIAGVLSRPGSPALNAPHASRKTKSMYPEKPIFTTQDFYDWFALIESSVVHSQEASYREHLETVEGHLNTCDELKNDLNGIFHDVDDMLEGWRAVEAGGRNLKEACELLLAERDRLIAVSEDVSARLEYFQELEHATRILNNPGEALVLQADFLDMIERVDICIDFLRIHRQYREAEIYLLRFQQCLTRAMTLIKIYFAGALKALSTDISRRLSEKDISQTAQMHLLYTRFQSVSTQVGPLLGELERRSSSHPDQLSSLLAECHSAYFAVRKSLVIGKVAEEIRGLDPGGADLVELTRSGCSYLKQLCMDEFALYRCFFNSGKNNLYAYLENLCDYLYDDLRPRILHEPRLSVLCDVCKVLQALMVLNVPDVDPNSDDEDEADDAEREADAVDGLGQLHISHMLQSVLQDAQTRLFFKAQTVVQTEIRYYVPKPADLDYPRTLENLATKGAITSSAVQQGDTNPFFQLTQLARQDTWYPTIRKTVEVLSQLRDFVQPTIFEDIAHEALDFCRLSLIPAATVLANRSEEASDLHAQLFLTMHILLLKQIGSSLHLATRESGSSFELRHVADLLRTTSLLSYPLSVSKPQDTQTTGAREGIDADLKRSCEAVINICARTFIKPLDDFMQYIGGGAPGKGAKATPTRADAFSAESTFKESLQNNVPGTVSHLRLYLAGDEFDGEGSGRGTVAVLLGHIQERVVDAFVTFRKAVEFIPADDEESTTRTFSSPEDIRAFFKP